MDKKPIDREYLKDNLHTLYNKINTEQSADTKVTHTTTEEVINDCADGYIRELHLEGNGRKSKNLLNSNVNKYKGNGEVYKTNGDRTYTINGVTCTNNGDGTYTLNGTAGQGGAWFYFTYSQYEVGKQYKIVGIQKNTEVFSDTKYAIKYDPWSGFVDNLVDWGNGVTFTAEKATYESAIIVRTGRTVTNEIVKPMLVDADLYPDTTYDDFEPYGLILSEGKVESQSKNLLKLTLQTTTQNGVTCTNNGDGTYTLNGTAGANTEFIIANDVNISDTNIEVDKTYKIVGCPNNAPTNVYLDFIERKSDNTFIRDNIDSGSGNNITIGQTTAIYRVKIYLKSGATANNLVFKPMLTEDTTLTYNDFVPYNHTSINTSEILNTDFIGLNDVKDELIIHSDGSGELIKRVIEVDGGSLDWKTETVSSGDNYYVKVSDSKPSSNVLMVDENAISDYTKQATERNNTWVSSGQYLNYTKDGFDKDISAFKTHMTGIPIVYELSTPTTTKLTPSQVTQLLSLKTFTDHTTITSDCEYEIGYFADTELGKAIADVDTTIKLSKPLIKTVRGTTTGKGNISLELPCDCIINSVRCTSHQARALVYDNNSNQWWATLTNPTVETYTVLANTSVVLEVIYTPV